MLWLKQAHNNNKDTYTIDCSEKNENWIHFKKKITLINWKILFS